jgi:hypothetical protein
MKILFTLFLILAYCNINSQILNHQSTSGPIPPKGVNIIGHISDEKNITVQNVIAGVPAYYWHQGCGPTAVGMVAGYYDSHGFPDLIPGDASTQTTAVNIAIGSVENLNDYCNPQDTYPNLLPDLSELPVGDEHINNSIADFMKTSQSVVGNYYGWSWDTDIEPSWTNYITYISPNYQGSSVGYYFSNFPWDSLVSNIDNNRPLVYLVDTDGDGVTDHFVCVNGYQTSGGVNYYGCLNTWDYTQHWYTFTQMASGVQWGIEGCFTFKIAMTTGIHENKNESGVYLNCYPNPSSSNLNIDVPQNSDIKILNIEGQMIKNILTKENHTSIDISGFPCGVYVVEIRTEKGVEVKKFVKE